MTVVDGASDIGGGGVPLITRATFRVGLLWAMGLIAVTYVSALTLYGLGRGPAMEGWYETVVNGWLAILTMWAPAALCWLAVYRVGLRRPEAVLAAAAVTSYAAGNTYYVFMTVDGGSLPYPSLADAGYLSLSPLMLAALIVAVRRHVRGLASSVWLDAVVGSLSAAAVLAVILSPVLASATTGPLSLATVVAVATPLFDMMLVAAVVGIAALGDVRMGSRWGLLVAGLLVFAAADVVYGRQVTTDTYVFGTPLDAGWAIGLALMALWVDGVAQDKRPMTQEVRPATGARALGVSSAATIAGLGVLIVGTRVALSTLAVTLAGVTLLAAAVRTQVAFRQLRTLQAELVESARQAGMAEIATNVLHNVGNVLNSVNVSADLVCEKVRGSKSGGLGKAVSLMNEHADDLAGFLTVDTRGKALPAYLNQLAATLATEREGIETELLRLTSGVAHIKEIVAAQQSLAGARRVTEWVRVSELVADALRMAGVDQAEVKVIQDLHTDPLLALDRHRVLLILVNLISNAMHAMGGNLDRPRQLSFQAYVIDGQGVTITVADSGVGVLPENLTRIFVHGFTTHADGHGFGLHGSALAAKEMGGALTVQQDAGDYGAAFTLRVPLDRELVSV